VKLQAIETCTVQGRQILCRWLRSSMALNNQQVGRMIEFALDNPKKISLLSFQPVSFTGRDEAITGRARQPSATRCPIWRAT